VPPVDPALGSGRAERPDLSVIRSDDDPGEPEPTPEVFSAIVIDPPWRYYKVGTRGAAEDHYPTMSLEELAALELPAADDAHLYLWVTNGFLREGFDLLDAWGFTYKTTLTWCKPQIGMGNWFRNSTEHVLFGVRGKCPTLRNDVPTHFTANRTRHSAKPESFYDLVESCSAGPWLEMFARRRRFGWHVWGNEA
jgi:N6-adenosine-specific RNA methylase IME4